MMVLTFVYDPPNYNIGFEINKSTLRCTVAFIGVPILWVSKHQKTRMKQAKGTECLSLTNGTVADGFYSLWCLGM